MASRVLALVEHPADRRPRAARAKGEPARGVGGVTRRGGSGGARLCPLPGWPGECGGGRREAGTPVVVLPPPWPPVPPAATIGYMTDQAASRPGTRALAWGLAGLILLVLAGALVLLAFNARVMTPTRIGAYGFAVVAVVVYAGVGGLIAARVPGNAIGWLLSLDRAAAGGEHVPGAVRPARPGHGARLTARGPAGHRARQQHTESGGRVADRPRPALPGRPPAVPPVAAGALDRDRGGHRVRARAVPAARHRHPGQPDQRAVGRARGVPEPVRRLPPQRLVQRPPRSGGADRGGRRPARAGFGIRPAARGVRRAAPAAGLAGLRRSAHAGLRGLS